MNAPESMIRLTTQRQILLEELSKVNSHPTACELYEMVRKRLPRIGLGTVYRNLELMADSGMILKLELGGRKNVLTPQPIPITMFAVRSAEKWRTSLLPSRNR